MSNDLSEQAARFRDWAAAGPPRPGGEWECDYEHWPSFYDSVLKFVDQHPFSSWSEDDVRDVLYAIARDNEFQYIASEIRRRTPELVLNLARASLRVGEKEDRWQLAVEAGALGPRLDVEQTLLLFAHDEHEYVRRRALKALLHIGSSAVEELSLAAWHCMDEHQQWARMMALYCLLKINSPHLEELLKDAEQDEGTYLREYAQRIRRGESLG